jgi:hypothetical protein
MAGYLGTDYLQEAARERHYLSQPIFTEGENCYDYNNIAYSSRLNFKYIGYR